MSKPKRTHFKLEVTHPSGKVVHLVLSPSNALAVMEELEAASQSTSSAVRQTLLERLAALFAC